MNPHLFCSTPRYPHVLLTTFNLDLAFFERVVFNRLSAGGAELPVVVADRSQFDLALAALRAPLRGLGRSFQVIDPPLAGAFHPKTILRLGEAGGQALLGSGNLSRGGWGFNQEMGAAWRMGPGTDDQGAWIRPILRSARDWAAEELEREKLQRMLDLPWVRRAEAAQSAPVLWSLEGPLAPQVSDRWEGRRFNELWVLSGSSDVRGRMIEWATEAFGLEKIRIGMTPDRCSFDPEALEALDVDVEFVAVERPPLHAKLYWFRGPGGNAAIVGSPNCSAAGWLAPPSTGGNVECVLLFDEAPGDAFSDLLTPLASDPVALREVLPALEETESGETDEVEAEPAPCRIQSAAYDARSGIIEIRLDTDPDFLGNMLLVDQEGLELPLQVRDGSCHAQVPPGRFRKGESKLVRVEIVDGEGKRTPTPPRWVSDTRALQGAGEGRDVTKAAEDLRVAVDSGDSDALLEGLARINHLLFGKGSRVKDVLGSRGRKKGEGQQNEPVPQLAADELLRSLDEVRAEEGHGGRSWRSMGGSLSTHMILRLLFPEAPEEEGEEEPEDGATVHRQELDDEVKAHGEEDDTELERVTVEVTTEAPAEGEEDTRRESQAKKRKAQAKRHARIMDGISKKMRDREDLADWEAEQMVSAVSFFVASLQLGIEKGWVGSDQQKDYAFSVCEEILGTEQRPSLLHELRGKYARMGAGEDFDAIVGDGRLWAVLLLVAGQLEVDTPGEALDLLVLLKNLMAERLLIRFQVPAETARLFKPMNVEEARRRGFKRCLQASRSLLVLEEQLEELGTDLLEIQKAAPPSHRLGDLFWSTVVGWAVALEDGSPKKIHVHEEKIRDTKGIRPAGFFVNVTAACRDGMARDLEEAFEGVRAAIVGLLGS